MALTLIRVESCYFFHCHPFFSLNDDRLGLYKQDGISFGSCQFQGEEKMITSFFFQEKKRKKCIKQGF